MIERARAAHGSGAIACSTRCSSPAEACAAGDRICEVAGGLAESDAAARCQAARQACTELRAAPAPVGCSCPSAASR